MASLGGNELNQGASWRLLTRPTVPGGRFSKPLGRLIFNIGIAIPGKTVFLIETAPRLVEELQETFWVNGHA